MIVWMQVTIGFSAVCLMPSFGSPKRLSRFRMYPSSRASPRRLCPLSVRSPKTGNVSRDVARTRKWESGGLEHVVFFPYIGNVIIPTDFHSIIFQRGRSTTNQLQMGFSRIFHELTHPGSWGLILGLFHAPEALHVFGLLERPAAVSQREGPVGWMVGWWRALGQPLIG